MTHQGPTSSKSDATLAKRVSRRDIVRAGAAGAAGVVTAGALGSAAAAPKRSQVFHAPALLGQATTQLTWAVPGNPEEVAVYQAIADTFMAENPNIEVTLDRESSDFQRLVTLIAGGEAPDVIFATINNWPAFAVRDVFLALDDFIAQDSYDIEDFYPQIVRPYQYNGERFGEGALYGLPKEIAIRSMYYNADIFTEAGIEAMPSADEVWDWARFIDVTQQTTLTEGPRTTQYGYVQETWWGPWMIWAWSAGGEAVDDPYFPTMSTLDTPEVLRGYKTYTDFVVELQTAPPTAVTADQGKSEIFAGGRAATYNNGRWMVPLFRNSEFAWDVMPMPMDQQRAQLLTGSIFGIYSGTERAEEAWQLLSYAVGAEGQSQMTELGLLLPSRRSVAESDVFLNSTPPESNRVYLDELEYARILPMHPNYPEMEQALNTENDLVLTGEKTAEEALVAMHEAVNLQLQSS